MALRNGEQLGTYAITAHIGAGGMGEVYRAHDTKLGRDVAIKVLPERFAREPERLARFQREAKMLAALNHPNIAAIYGLEQSGNMHYLIMELVEGPTLADRILSGAIPVDEALPIARQIADAVEYAHDKNVMHRDLKPANIKVREDGTVKVLDFGLAKAMSEEIAAEDMANSPTLSMAATRQGMILGTAAYMSPEQTKGKVLDRRTDVWAFGAVFFEMLTGKQAFPGEDITDILAAVVKSEPAFGTLPPATPPTIRTLIRRCMEKNLRRRLGHISEARILIEDVLSGAISATVDGPPAPIGRLAYPGLLGWIAAGALLLALGALSFIHFREVAPTVPSLRFDLAPPEKAVLATFKLSPNGRYLVFTALREGKIQLWLRALDSLEAKVLPGTDNADKPFWSPDSSSIGFFAQGKLKKISLNGGPAQTICDAPGGRGGAWNRDGVIVFAPNINGGLFRVPAAGGTPTEVTKVTTQGTNDTHRFPEFILGGDRFTFFYQGEKEVSGIYIGFLDGKPPVRILAGDSNAVYVSPSAPGQSGRLLFTREATLMAQSFDPERLQPIGEAIPLMEQVGYAQTTGNGAFSASENGLLAYRIGGVVGNRELVWIDRLGRRMGTIAKPAMINSETLSRDEKTIAVSLRDEAGNDNLWLQDLGRGVASRFTFEPGFITAPVWSPNDSHLTFSIRTVAGAYSLSQKAVNGNGQQEELSRARINAYPWDWSPDGKFVLYSDTGEKTNYDLWLLPLTGDPSAGSGQVHKPIPFLQTQFNEGHGQFSPDGRWVAYASDESGKLEIYVQPIPMNGGKWQVSAAGGDFPRWRKDGKELYYISGDGNLTAVPVKAGSAASNSFETGIAQPLFAVQSLGTTIATRFPYQPTSDGQRFLVNVPAGGEGAGGPPITVTLNWQAGLKK